MRIVKEVLKQLLMIAVVLSAGAVLDVMTAKAPTCESGKVPVMGLNYRWTCTDHLGWRD